MSARKTCLEIRVIRRRLDTGPGRVNERDCRALNAGMTRARFESIPPDDPVDCQSLTTVALVCSLPAFPANSQLHSACRE